MFFDFTSISDVYDVFLIYETTTKQTISNIFKLQFEQFAYVHLHANSSKEVFRYLFRGCNNPYHSACQRKYLTQNELIPQCQSKSQNPIHNIIILKLSLAGVIAKN